MESCPAVTLAISAILLSVAPGRLCPRMTGVPNLTIWTKILLLMCELAHPTRFELVTPAFGGPKQGESFQCVADFSPAPSRSRRLCWILSCKDRERLAGGKRVVVTMEHAATDVSSKPLKRCTLPLMGGGRHGDTEPNAFTLVLDCGSMPQVGARFSEWSHHSWLTVNSRERTRELVECETLACRKDMDYIVCIQMI